MKYLEYLENTKVQLTILVIIFGFSLFKTIKSNDRQTYFKKQGWHTVGEIIDHNVTGIHENFYVKFSYEVENKKYIETVNYRSKFRDCYLDRRCIGKKFTVYFDKNNPSEVYIDFDDEK